MDQPTIGTALREFQVLAGVIGIVSGFIGNIIGGRVTARWLEKNQAAMWSAVRELRAEQVEQGKEFAEIKGRCDTVMKFDLHTKKKNVYHDGTAGP